MTLKMNLLYAESIETLIKKHPCFQILKNAAIWEYEDDDLLTLLEEDDPPQSMKYRWDVPDHMFFDHMTQVSVLPVMLIGKTGYGKSSLLNSMIGQTVFKTDDIRSCTKEIDAAFFRMGSDPRYYLALCDLPGIGESEKADRQYMKWYSGLLESSPSIVYVLRADQRDFAVDERVFGELLSNEAVHEKVVIALNYADKIEPISREKYISETQLEALKRKAESISNLFDVPDERIVACSALTGYGVRRLLEQIADDLEQYVFEPM